MKPNKSIDGLKVRSAKNSPVSATKTVKTAKPTKATRPAKANVAKPIRTRPLPKIPTAAEIFDENGDTLKIEVRPTDQVAKTPKIHASKPKTAKTHEEAVEDFLKPVQAFDYSDDGELKKSKKFMNKSDKADKPKKEKKKPSKKRRIITSIALVIVLLLSGLILWAVLWGNDIIAKITGGQGNVFDLVKFVEPTYEPLKTDANGRTNILAFGTSGYNMEGDEGNGTHDGAQLTDSIMMISLNQETGDIAMLSLPRDLKASPTCTATGKINEVYWCNNMNGENEEAGATALMAEVGSILGVEFQYYAHLNWGSLIQIVDLLGGVQVTLDEDINDQFWTGAVYEAGVEYTLNGEEALGLARARHGTAGGDFTRGASQQKILIAIKDKLVSKDLSITDYLGLINTLGDNFRSNFSIDDLKTLAHLTFDFDFESMRQIALWPDYMTTGGINGISYVIPRAGVGNYGKIQDYVAKLLSNDPRSYEEPTIAILNASEEVGVASDEKVKLTDEGYVITVTDNAPEGEYEIGYTLYAVGNKPGTKAMLEKYYNLNAISGDDIPAHIPRDYDFVIIVNPEPTTTEE